MCEWKTGTESGGSLLLKNDTKMAELPKGIGSYGGAGLFVSDLRPYSRGGDIKSRVKGIGGYRIILAIILITKTHQLS